MPYHLPADRITKLLTGGSTPRIQDVASAFLQSIAGGHRQTGGEILNAQRAAQIEEAKTLYEVFGKERDFRMKEEELKLKKETLGLTREKMLWDNIRAANKDVADAIEFMVPNETARDDVIGYLDRLPTEINALNVYQEVSKAIPLLQAQGVKIEKPKEPPTGYRYNDVGVLEMDPGYEAGELSMYAAKKAIDQKYDDAATTMGFGNSIEGIARNVVAEAQTRHQQGVRLSQEELVYFQQAIDILTQPRVQATDIKQADGSITREWVEVTPPLPAGIDVRGILGGTPAAPLDQPTPGEYAPPMTQPAQPITPTQPAQQPVAVAGASTVKKIGGVTKEPTSVPLIINTVVDAVNILEEAARAGETITGWKGWAKAEGGGLGRQFNVPITPRASRLQRALTELQILLRRSYITEANPSDKEQARINELVKNISVANDDQEIFDSLNAVLNYIEEKHGGLPSGQ